MVRSDELLYIKHLEQHLACRKHSTVGRCHATIPEVNLAFSQGLLCVGVGRETCLLWCLGLKEGRPSPLERSRTVLHYWCLQDAWWPQPRAASLCRQVRAGTQQKPSPGTDPASCSSFISEAFS